MLKLDAGGNPALEYRCTKPNALCTELITIFRKWLRRTQIHPKGRWSLLAEVRRLQTHALTLLQGAVTAMRRSSPGLLLGGALSIALNCWSLSVFGLKKT